jgi:glycosyltransferase involved in cell wall biosynthesis
MVHSLYSYLMQHRIDVLFCPGNTYAVVGAATKLLLGDHSPPMVLKVSNALDRRDMGPALRRGYAAWLRVQGHVFDCAVALSEPMRDEVRERMRCAPRQLRVIPNPLLTRERLRRLGRTRDKPRSAWATRYLAAGRLVVQKNYPLLLRAFARSARPEDTLTIAGDGPERALLERLALHLGIAGQVRFAGHVAAIDALLAEADCLVLSSDYEGLPGVVVEALAAGIPVLATDCCVSMACLLEPGRTGLIVPPGDESALARGLVEIRSMPVDRERARRTAATYEVESAASRYLDLMQDIVRRRQRDRSRALALSTLSSRPFLDGLR